MKAIETRKDISILVHAFYDRIREDELLGPIFNGHIAEEKWPVHLNKLTDFWESNLFGAASFSGSPSKKHIQVDTNVGHTINQAHFAHWLELWFESIDGMFEGTMAFKAKESARKMATGQFLTILKYRA